MEDNVNIEFTSDDSENDDEIMVALGDAINKRNKVKKNLDDAIDASTNLGYELGVIDERERWADTLEKLISRIDEGDVAINEALAYLSSMTIKDSTQD